MECFNLRQKYNKPLIHQLYRLWTSIGVDNFAAHINTDIMDGFRFQNYAIQKDFSAIKLQILHESQNYSIVLLSEMGTLFQ